VKNRNRQRGIIVRCGAQAHLRVSSLDNLPLLDPASQPASQPASISNSARQCNVISSLSVTEGGEKQNINRGRMIYHHGTNHGKWEETLPRIWRQGCHHPETNMERNLQPTIIIVTLLTGSLVGYRSRVLRHDGSCSTDRGVYHVSIYPTYIPIVPQRWIFCMTWYQIR
jgi:hypothetical protein